MIDLVDLLVLINLVGLVDQVCLVCMVEQIELGFQILLSLVIDEDCESSDRYSGCYDCEYSTCPESLFRRIFGWLIRVIGVR